MTGRGARAGRWLAPVWMAMVLVACAGGTTGSGSPAATLGVGVGSPTPVGAGTLLPSASAQAIRPSSPATVSIVSPTNDLVVTGSSVHVVIALQHAQIVQATTTSLSPTEGHLHLYVDGSLVSMNYALVQDLPVSPGTYQLKAEFVAADHAPFNPRVWSQVVVFIVH